MIQNTKLNKHYFFQYPFLRLETRKIKIKEYHTMYYTAKSPEISGTDVTAFLLQKIKLKAINLKLRTCRYWVEL